jgi:hypothetical protein
MYQNHILAIQHVVMINYLGSDAMYYLTDRIQTITGVLYEVIPTKKVSENGKFYVLVDKKAVSDVRESLTKTFDRWFQEFVPEDARPKPGRFDGPPEIGKPKSDGYSSGDNSWITASTKSFLTYSVKNMETDTSVESQDLDSAWEQRTTATTQSKSSTPPQRPIGKTFESYAAATSFDQVSGMTEPEHPRDVRHDELSSKITNLEAMIVQLCQQVQALTNRPVKPTVALAYRRTVYCPVECTGHTVQ